MSQARQSRYASPFAIFLFGLLLILNGTALAQKSARKKSKSVSVQKTKPASTPGICGTVVVKRGNHMPGPGRPISTGQPAVREIYVYPLTTIDEVESDEAGFIQNLPTKPIQVTTSDKDGKFCLSGLPAGRYSVLVKEEQGLYTSVFDVENHLNPVTVTPGKTTTVTIQITHQAAF